MIVVSSSSIAQAPPFPVKKLYLGWHLPMQSAYSFLIERVVENKDLKIGYKTKSFKIDLEKGIWSKLKSKTANPSYKIERTFFDEQDYSLMDFEDVSGIVLFLDDSDNVLCIKRSFIRIRQERIEEILDKYLAIRLLHGTPLFFIPVEYAPKSYIYDEDDDGIWESMIQPDQNDELSEQKVLEYIIAVKQKERDEKNNFSLIKKSIIDFINCPMSENAKKMCDLIPSLNLYPEFNDEIQLKKRLWEFELNEKLEAEGKLGRNFRVAEIQSEQEDFWFWLSQNMSTFELEAYSGDELVIRSLFKLFPIFMSIKFQHYVNFQMLDQKKEEFRYSKLDRILDNLIRIQPEKFLKELKENKHKVRLQDVLDGSFGLEFIGRSREKYLQVQKKIDALSRVTDKPLIEIRDLCLRFLKKEKEFLEDKFEANLKPGN